MSLFRFRKHICFASLVLITSANTFASECGPSLGRISTLSEKNEIPMATEVFVSAFENYPLDSYAKQITKRDYSLKHLYAGVTRYGFLYGTIWVYRTRADNNVAGAAIILPPQHSVQTALKSIRAGLWRTPLFIGIPGTACYFRIAQQNNRIRKHLCPGCLYLQLIGTRKGYQGKGIGTLLLTKIIEEADKTHQSIFLETQDPSNLAFFRRFGFQMRDLRDFPGDPNGPITYYMTRTFNLHTASAE